MNRNLLIVGEAGVMEEAVEAARAMAGIPFDRIDCVPAGRFMSRGSAKIAACAPARSEQNQYQYDDDQASALGGTPDFPMRAGVAYVPAWDHAWDELSGMARDHAFGFAAAGRGEARLLLLDRMEEAGFSIATIVHPSAQISPSASVAAGCYIGANVCVGAGAALGRGCSLAVGAIVGRGALVGDGCTMGLGAIAREATVLPRGAVVGDGEAFPVANTAASTMALPFAVQKNAGAVSGTRDPGLQAAGAAHAAGNAGRDGESGRADAGSPCRGNQGAGAAGGAARQGAPRPDADWMAWYEAKHGERPSFF